MVQTITGYLYDQVIPMVTYLDTSPNRENVLFYARPLDIYKGVDNSFKLQFKNQDAKLQSILDTDIEFVLTDPTTLEQVFSRRVTIVPEQRGIGTIMLAAAELDDVSAGNYLYSIKIITGEGVTQVAFADTNYNAQGKAYVNDSVYPRFQPSVMANLLAYQNNSDTGYANTALTSTIMTYDRVKVRAVAQTVQYSCTGFTGNITAQATLDPQPSSLLNGNTWFNVGNTITINNQTGNYSFNFQGKFAGVRFKVCQTTGNMDRILYRG
jgi:hypothetical protein